MTKKATKYEINEKDIDSTLRYLKIFHPDYATPENAIAFLEYLQSGAHILQHENPEMLEKLWEELKEQKRLKTN